jgi:hypothetical protein
MKVADFLRERVFSRGKAAQKESIRTLKGLPKEKLKQEMGLLFHDMCVKRATSFVKDELNKNDSPFKGVPKSRLFQEIMILNYWILDNAVSKNKKAVVLDEVYNKHFELFNVTFKREEELASLLERHRAYYDSWNEVTGHQDKFGLKAAEFIFDKNGDIPRIAEVSFWIISYTHSAMKAFRDMNKKQSAH